MRDAGWDRWARVYAPLERLLFGRRLQQTRELAARMAARMAARIAARRTAGRAADSGGDLPWLVVGDGDGRGLASLLSALPEARFVSVDGSPAMLRRSSTRTTGAEAERVTLVQGVLPGAPRPDQLPNGVAGIVTCFFLDCFTERELAEVWERLAGLVHPGGTWIVADFTPPERLRGWRRVVQRGLLAVLYRAFGWSTPMRARTLPELDAPFLRGGWERVDQRDVGSGWTRVVAWRKPSGTGIV